MCGGAQCVSARARCTTHTCAAGGWHVAGGLGRVRTRMSSGWWGLEREWGSWLKVSVCSRCGAPATCVTSAALRLYLYQRATKLGHWCKLGHSCCVAQTVLLASLHTASLHTTSPPACHTSGRWQGEQAKKNGNQSLKACQHAPVNGMAGQPSARQSPSVQTKTTSRSICSTLGCRK